MIKVTRTYNRFEYSNYRSIYLEIAA